MKCFYFDDERTDLDLISRPLKQRFWPEVRRIVQEQYHLDDPGDLEIDLFTDGPQAVAVWSEKMKDYDLLIVDLIDAPHIVGKEELQRGAELASLARRGTKKTHAIIAISRVEQSQKHIGWARRQFENAARLGKPGDYGTWGCAYINKAEVIQEREESYLLEPEDMARILIPVLMDAGVLDNRVSVNRLKFDPSNPRLLGVDWNGENPTESDIRDLYWDELDAEELAASMAEHGFWQEEPLYVDLDNNGKLLVKEGNRRLAAVKGLIDSTPHPNAATILAASPNLERLKRLPILPANSDTNEDFQRFIAFRHLNSNMRWGTYARARYIAVAVNENHESLAALATRVGDTTGTVRMLYRAYQAVDQAERMMCFDRAQRANHPGKLAFSQLVFGLQRPGVVNFLGMAKAKDNARDPVPKSHLENLRLLMLWVFGNRHENIEPVIVGDEEDWADLEQVLLDENAVAQLKSGAQLHEIMEELQPASVRITTLLASAENHLQGVEHLLGEVSQATVLHQDIAASLENLSTHCAAVARRLAEHGHKPSITG